MVPTHLLSIPASQQEEGARIVAAELYLHVLWLHLGTECIV